MLVYLASVPGGWIADNILGQKKTVMIGGVLLCIGHSILAFDNEISFYLGCFFVILGVGGLKPNISSIAKSFVLLTLVTFALYESIL